MQLGMLKHGLAGLFALAAIFRARLHMGVRSKLFAGRRTFRACLSTGGADQLGVRSTSRNNAGCRGAQIGAILAACQRGRMILMPRGKFPRAVRRATIAGSLTRPAGLGAGLMMLCMHVLMCGLSGLGRHGGQSTRLRGQNGGRKSRDSKVSSIKHLEVSHYEQSRLEL